MSAYLVKSDTIATIAKFAIDNDLLRYGCCCDNQYKYNTIEKTAEVLARKNIDSVNYRYNEEYDDNDKRYIQECIDKSKVKTFVLDYPHKENIAPVIMAKTLSCYSYQSCEEEDFFKSDAFHILTVCREALLRNLPGYEQADG